MTGWGTEQAAWDKVNLISHRLFEQSILYILNSHKFRIANMDRGPVHIGVFSRNFYSCLFIEMPTLVLAEGMKPRIYQGLAYSSVNTATANYRRMNKGLH
nr:hypothetical protein [Ammoniphilus sp. YIM 78166]